MITHDQKAEQTDRRTYGQTDRQDKQTDRQTDRQRLGQKDKTRRHVRGTNCSIWGTDKGHEN